MVVVKIIVAEVEPERLGEEVEPELLGEEVEPELLGEEVEPELLGEEVQPEYLEEQVSVVVEVEPGDKDLRANHLSLKYLGKKLTQTQMRSHQYCHLLNLLVLYEAFLTIALLLSSTLL